MLILPNGLSADQETEPLPGPHVKLFLDFEAMCRYYGLRFALFCNTCRERGMKDGVRGANALSDQTYIVECGHRILEWTNHANHG